MIREFGPRAAEVARRQQDGADPEAQAVWSSVADLIERSFAIRRFHSERQQHALRMAASAKDPAIRQLHLELAELHSARARKG